MRLAMILMLGLAAACGAPPAGTLRFKVEPPVWRVADTTPFTKPPTERVYNRTLYQTDSFVVRRTTRALDVLEPTRALDTNSLDEVPDSTWFTNRIGVRDISIDELRRGADIDPSPIDHLPWTIKSAKVGGLSVGFVFEDAKGDKYLLKFDEGSRPEMETGAHVIGQRLLWAAGYNVPQDYLAFIRREDIVISPKATAKNAQGEKTPLTAANFDKAVAPMFKTTDGKFRVLASRYLPGKPIGPYAREGRRADDPNDRIDHENRRSVRGQVPLFAWINHTDLQEDNTLDVFVKDHVVHYLIDFGKAFGVMNNSNAWKTVGYTNRIDFTMALRTLVTFGLWDRPWDNIDAPNIQGVALFEAAHFDPATWRINAPYWPFDDADATDTYWGAKLVMRFTKEQIEAAVAEAHFSDPRASAYILATLLERQRRVGRYWLDRVSPLDRFALEPAGTGARLCFDDLARTYGLQPAASRYSVEVFDGTGAVIAPHAVLAPSATGARICTAAFPIGGDASQYTIVKLAAARNARALPPVSVHLARTKTGALEVIGIRRN